MPFDINSAVEITPNTSPSIQTSQFDPSTAEELNPPAVKSTPSLSGFLRSIFGTSVLEQYQTNLYAVTNKSKIPIVSKNDNMQSYLQKYQEFLAPRERDIIKQGVLRQVEGPMQLAMGSAALSPSKALPALKEGASLFQKGVQLMKEEPAIATAVGVTGFAIKDAFFNARRMIEENAPNTPMVVKDLAEVLDLAATGFALGGGLGYVKDFITKRLDHINAPKAVDIQPEQIDAIKNDERIKSTLGITQEHIDASINGQLPIQVPVDKVLDLAMDKNWAQTKMDLGLENKVETPELQPKNLETPNEKIRGLSLSTESSAIEQGLKEDINQSLPRYQTRPIKQIAEDLSKFVSDNPEKAKDIALGKTDVPNGMREEEIYSAVRTKAMREGDYQTLKELAQSDYVSALATEAGQRVKALDITEPRNPIKDMQEIISERSKPDEAKLKSTKTRLTNLEKKYQQKIDQLNFETDPRKKTILDSEAKALKEQVDSLKRVFESGKKIKGTITDNEAKTLVTLSKDIMDKERIVNDSPRRGLNDSPTKQEMDWGLSQVAYDNYFNELKFGKPKIDLAKYKENPGKFIYDLTGITKSLASSLDNSFIGRQGIKLFYKGLTGDVKAGKIWLDTFKNSFKYIFDTFGGKPVMNYIRAEILSDPMYPMIKKAGVDTAVTEEAYPTSLISKIPIVGKPFEASENAFTGAAHYMRYKLAKLEFDIAEKAGVDLTDDTQLKSIGKLVNSLTGRGDIGGKTKSPGILNNVFFSPRFIKSQIDVLTAHQFDNVSPYVKKRAAENLLRIIIGQALVLGVAKIISPNSVEEDPHSADFGKIKSGNTRFDVSGGAASFITLASRLGPLLAGQESYTKSSVTGKSKKLNTGKFGQSTGADVLFNFLENKTSPLARIILDNLKGKDMQGQKPSLASNVGNIVTPLPIKNAQELMNDPNAANLIVGIIADELGISTNTYSYKKKAKF